ncbi:MAG: MarR family transcriptional regulator [Actinomyces sp.]|nr:MarR family transcriptional regulator [Actinomyces sp.]MDN6428762.1 MarR family transcriptional regulator [Propionibacterium sp.]MDN6566080.1 MarR family transcriptional regulator [Actinomyces sp.]
MSSDREELRGELMGAWHDWIVAGRTFGAHLDRVLAEEVDLTLVDVELLDGLAQSSQPRRMCDLGRSVALTRSGATRAVTRLERLGLVRRRPSPSDGRSTVVEISDPGREVHGRAVAVLEREVHAGFIEVLGEEATVHEGAVARRIRAALLGTPACQAHLQEEMNAPV